MAKYNRFKFLNFAKMRASKHAGFIKKSGDEYLNQSFVTEPTVRSVLLMISQFDYALMGGLALGYHGYQRATTDIDIMVKQQDIPQIIQIFGLRDIRPLNIGGVSGVNNNINVDLISPDCPWVDDALSDVQNTPNGKVLSKPFIVISKLWAARGAVDDMDILQIVKNMTLVEKDRTRMLVKKYVPNDVEDLEQMFDISGYV